MVYLAGCRWMVGNVHASACRRVTSASLRDHRGARILRMGRATLYERIRAGEIKAQKDGRRRYITAESCRGTSWRKVNAEQRPDPCYASPQMKKSEQNVRPRCLVVAGPNGAGKTTFAREFLPNDERILNFVNADLIAGGLSPLKPELAAIAAGRWFSRRLIALSKGEPTLRLRAR